MVIIEPNAPVERRFLYSGYDDGTGYFVRNPPSDQFFTLRIQQVVEGTLTLALDGATQTFYTRPEDLTSAVGTSIPTGALDFTSPTSLNFFLDPFTTDGLEVAPGQIASLNVDYTPGAVPEPSSVVLFGLGFATFAASALRRRRKGVSPNSSRPESAACVHYPLIPSASAGGSPGCLTRTHVVAELARKPAWRLTTRSLPQQWHRDRRRRRRC